MAHDPEKSSPSPSASTSAADDHDLPPSARDPTAHDSDSSPQMIPSKYKDKDPSKPKRKKARRACAACQRAHLTCSDERPCERCIKRNLADQCQDGARKKAKYLHDAPNEALMPGHANKYRRDDGSLVPAAERQPMTMQHYQAPIQQHNVSMPTPDEFKMQSPASSAFDSQQPSPLHQAPLRSSHAASSPHSLNQQPPGFPQQYMEPSDAGMFNFDIPSMNFGNHYGALEFGMLGNMGQGQSPHAAGFPYDSAQPLPDGRGSGDYPIGSADSLAWPDALKSIPVGPFDPMGGNLDQWRRNSQAHPHAYAIGTGSNGFAGQSPASSIDMFPHDFATPPDMNASTAAARQAQQQQMASSTAKRRHSNPPPGRHPPQSPDTQGQTAQPALRLTEPNEAISRKLAGSLRLHPAFAKRRQRDPSSIYKNVTKPYPYTLAFHALTAVITRRFPSKKRLRIAKALASIRPSFISLNRNLTDPDLVFMEQNFQRCIWDYEEDSSACGTPTLIIRRTGEVAYADKEFTLLSGWTKEVLSGRSPNLNTNKAAADANPSASGTATAASSRGGFNTPRNGAADGPAHVDESAATASSETLQSKRRQQPVFLAELMDDDSVVDFYEEYSQRAFGDSRGTTSRRCKLLKYKGPRTSSEDNTPSDANANGASKGGSKRRNSVPDKADDKAVVSTVNGIEGRRGRPGISSEEGMKRLGDEKGAVDCMYCWMVKQDCFNIPMLIVINFLPIL